MAVRYWEGDRKLLAEMKWLLSTGSGRFSPQDKVFGQLFSAARGCWCVAGSRRGIGEPARNRGN